MRVLAAVAQRLRGLVDRVVVQPGRADVLMSDGGLGYVSGY